MKPSEILASGNPYDIVLTASDAERDALTERFGLSSLAKFESSLSLVPTGIEDGIAVSGCLSAKVGQHCVVTLEEVVSDILYEFDVTLYPSEREGDEVLEDQNVDFYDDDMLDLAELSAVELALSLDPYPRKEGVSITDAGPGIEGVELHVEEEFDTPPAGKRRPFEALAALREKK